MVTPRKCDKCPKTGLIIQTGTLYCFSCWDEFMKKTRTACRCGNTLIVGWFKGKVGLSEDHMIDTQIPLCMSCVRNIVEEKLG